VKAAEFPPSVDNDVAFHRAIVMAARNSVLSRVYNLVVGLLFQTYKYSALMDINARRSIAKNLYAQHKDIATAIQAHAAAAAVRRLMRLHLDTAERRLIGNMETLGRKSYEAVTAQQLCSKTKLGL
jgi:DNA-binding FadR family transcriptional regulator